MTKIDIFSGFLGAGKTTLIKKLIAEAYAGEKLVLIENEFGEIGVDGGFLADAGVNITEMNSGCICCSLVGDFAKALKKVIEEYHPDRVIIEPSGVGKLSDVVRAVRDVADLDAEINGVTTVADAKKCKMYMKNFGEFYNDQVTYAGTIVLSHTAGMSEEKLGACVEMLRGLNPDAVIVTTDWNDLDGKTILGAIEDKRTLAGELSELLEEEKVCPVCGHHHDDENDHDHEHHHHHHDDDDEDGHEHCCHHHDDDDDHDHEHHHHHDDDDEDEHEHHHHHDGCGCGHDHSHGHHHADEVFTSWGAETTHKYTAGGIRAALEALTDETVYGLVLRAKGIVAGEDGKWIYSDYVPGEADVRYGAAAVTGRLCVIGSSLKEDALKELFNV